MAKVDDKLPKGWIKNLWANCNKQNAEKNDSLWSRVSEMVSAFNEELQMQKHNRRMKPDSVPVGVDCTLSPILPPTVTSSSRNEFAAAAVAPIESATSAPVKRLVCSPDLPVYPLVSTTRSQTDETMVDSSTQAQPIQGPYRCSMCNESFSQKGGLTAHMKTHSTATDDPYRCSFCGKTFTVPARLTRHYRTHTGEKPYQCEYCNKSFSVKENLSVHKRIHTKERPYKCEICERAFEHSGKLHRHMRIHTGERPHKCSYCSKTFIQSGQLVIHQRTHTGEKPYVCKVCKKGFTCSKQLKVHTRTHTGEKPYACDICGKSFGYNHVLKLHQVAHFGEKVYKCTLCQETFTSKKSMETHIKVVHSETPRNNVDGESSASTSDKENHMEVMQEQQQQQQLLNHQVQQQQQQQQQHQQPQQLHHLHQLSPISTGTATTLVNLSTMSQSHLIPTSTSVYERYVHNSSASTCTTTNAGPAPSVIASGGESLRNFAGSAFYLQMSPTAMSQPAALPVPSAHRAADRFNGGGGHNRPNSTLLAVAATADELAVDETCYRQQQQQHHQQHYPQYFHHHQQPSPHLASPYAAHSSESSRSSPSPRLEIIESSDNAAYVLPDNERETESDADAAAAAALNASVSPSPPSSSSPSSVISHVPGDERRPPSSSSGSGSPVPLSPSPETVDLLPAEKDELCLPPRKRTKMILKSMQKDREDINFRHNSVIQYAKASQIFSMR